MNMIAYDSHAYIKKLIAKGIPEDVAEIHAGEFKKIIENNLATKNDLEALRADLKKDQDVLRAELKKDLTIGLERTKADILKWMIGMFVTFFFGLGALMLAVLSYFSPGGAP